MSKANHVDPTYELRQLIDGLLLGDGSLTKIGGFVFVNKSTDFANHVKHELQRAGLFVRHYKNDKYHRLETRVYDYLKEERARWYCPHKIIPSNLILTPSICLMWYLGDGSLSKVPKNDWITYGVQLHTECFSHDDQIRLVHLLQENGIKCKVMARNNGKKNYEYIVLGADSYQSFFDYIETCPLQDMSYKWPKSNPKRDLLTKRQKKALELRRQGLGVRKMGEAMGISPAAAFSLLKYLRGKLGDLPELRSFKPGPKGDENNAHHMRTPEEFGW